MLTFGAAVRIEPMTSDHADAVLAIYQAGIDEGDATFETRAPDWAAFTAARLPAHRFVATAAGQVMGWVAASPVSGRCVYAGVVEHSVYVHPAARGQGAGRRLLDTLIASTEAAGIWTIQSGIFPENTASLALHQAAGFRVVGTRERIGQHHGRWRDVVLIERRSSAVLPVSSRRAARRAGCARVNSAAIRPRSPNSATAPCAAASGSDLGPGAARSFLQAAGQLLHHRPGQLAGQRVEIAGDQAGSAHRASTRSFRSSTSIGSNATLTLPSRQYVRYSDSYM